MELHSQTMGVHNRQEGARSHHESEPVRSHREWERVRSPQRVEGLDCIRHVLLVDLGNQYEEVYILPDQTLDHKIHRRHEGYDNLSHHDTPHVVVTYIPHRTRCCRDQQEVGILLGVV